MKNNKKRTAFAALAVVATMSLSSCGYNVPSDMIAIHVGSGPLEAKKVKGDCIDPATRKMWFRTNDDYPLLPTNEREWDATGQRGSDSGRMKAVTADSVEMYIPVTIRFTLDTSDCKKMQDFYVRYIRRYGVEFEDDGTYNEAWITLLRKLIADPTDATLDRIIQTYNWRKVWNDPTTKTAIEKELNDALTGKSGTSLLEVTAKGQFFTGISVLVGKPEPVNQELSTAVALEQTNVAKAQSAEAQADADAAKSRAELAVSRADAAKKRAAIEGFLLKGMSPKEAMRAYNEAQLIEKGGNPYQPTYIVGGTVR